MWPLVCLSFYLLVMETPVWPLHVNIQELSVFLLASDGNTSVATHTYSMAGEYPVTVSIWNHLQKEPVIARLPTLVIVQDPVTAVHLKQLPMVTTDGQKINISGAYFYRHDNRSAPVVFEAK